VSRWSWSRKKDPPPEVRIGEASGDRAGTFCICGEKGKVELGAPGDACRIDGRFPAMDPGPSTVSGKKILELPSTSWSKKFFAAVRKLATSKVQPAREW